MPPALSRATREWLSLLGAEIRVARLQKGIALSDLAVRIGVTRQTVSALESGTPTVAVGTVFEAAAVLQIQLLRTDQDSVRERLAQTRQLILIGGKISHMQSPAKVVIWYRSKESPRSSFS